MKFKSNILQKDIDDFTNERKIFSDMLARYSFIDAKTCRNINRLIVQLDNLIDRCKKEMREHECKTNIPELFGNRADVSVEEVDTRDTNPVDAEPQRQTSWFA